MAAENAKDHELFKETCMDSLKIQYGLSKFKGTDLDWFVRYVLSVNPHMFFTLDNITTLTNFINDSTITRDFILNLTDMVILSSQGAGCDLDKVIGNIVSMVQINKNSNKVYDSRLADSVRFDKESLIELLENNSYIFIMYYICLYPIDLLQFLDIKS